jgi:tRNA threonylcarbamoyladenosine biosynthesis protein TsaE
MNIAERLMNGLSRPLSLILALHGSLGAGKTVFAKGVARALGITDPIRSPSYTLVREYEIPLARHQVLGTRHYFYHIDAWRLSDPSEFLDLGLGRMLKPGNVIVIEWIERMAMLMKDLGEKAKMVIVEIEVIDREKRRIKITM